MKTGGVYLPAVFMISALALTARINAGPALMPAPQSFRRLSGDSFELKQSTRIAIESESLRPIADMLADYLRPATGFELAVERGAARANSIQMRLDSALDGLGSEGYRLEADGDGVTISAPKEAGLFYGIQSLRQLLPVEIFSDKPVADTVWSVPAVLIEDRPRFGWRAFMLDEGRYFKGKYAVKLLLDQMAALKMNVFHWHLTDDQGWRIEIKEYPRLTEVGSKRADTQIGGWNSPQRSGRPHSGFYTQDEIREIVAYAAARQIMIVPEIGMPGHIAAAVAAYPELGTTGEQIEVPVVFGKIPQALNVADENVYRIMNDILDEVVELFPGPVIHIGGDEVRFHVWRDSPAIAELMEREGLKTLADVQIYFTNRMSNDIAAKGRRTMGWNEILGHDLHGFLKDGQTASASTLDHGTIIHFWKGAPALAREAVERGHELVNSWNAATYLDYDYKRISLRKAYEFEPVFRGLEPRHHDKVLGLGCQMWGEWIPELSDMLLKVFPRLAAYAEVGWTPRAARDYDDFHRRMLVQAARWDIQGLEYHKPALAQDRPADNAPILARWSPADISTEWSDIEFALPDLSIDDFPLKLDFRYRRGRHGIDIAAVELLHDGRLLASDEHRGFAGNRPRNSVYKLSPPETTPTRGLRIRARIKGSEGSNSQGEITILD